MFVHLQRRISLREFRSIDFYLEEIQTPHKDVIRLIFVDSQGISSDRNLLHFYDNRNEFKRKNENSELTHEF